MGEPSPPGPGLLTTLPAAAGGEPARLLAERALYLPVSRTLLVADVHLGKAVSFRRLGVPVPEATTGATLARLTDALAATQARRLVVLGDLLHSARSAAADTWAEVQRWRDRHAQVDWILVRGNHDRHAGDPPPAWGVQCVSEPWPLGDALRLAHHPDAVTGHYVLAGHVHPAVVIRGRGPGRLRLPCFHFGRQVGLLPAFGDFTGSHVLAAGPDDAVYAVAEDQVVSLATLRPR